MARSVNKVILIGHLGDDPELRYTESGTAVCNMSLATDESYVDGDGNEVDRTEWHDVVAWGRLAEVCGEHLSKGSQVHFEGSLQTNQWEDREGNTRYSTEVKAREMMFLDSNRQGQSSGHSSPKPQSSGQPNGGQSGRPSGKSERTSSEPPTNGNPSREKGNSDDDTFEPDDDLPF